MLALLLLGYAAGVSAHSAVEPVPREWKGFLERVHLLNERATKAGRGAQLLFVGDSITQGWEDAGKAAWEKHYASRGALNIGVGGDGTQNVLWRLDQGNVDGIDPRLAVVMIGTNNVTAGNTVAQVVEGVTAVVAKLRQKLPRTRVLLVGILPREENPGMVRGTVLQINQVLQQLEDGQSVFWLDAGSRFVARDGTISRELMPDFLHLSPSGYALWAETMEERITALLAQPR